MIIKIIKIILFSGISSFAFSQNANRISFDYDTAGNQSRRYICLCTEKQSSEVAVKEVEQLNEDNLQKLNEEDLISFYPNPLQEKLFLKWELINNKKVTQIELYTFSGQLINSYNDLETVNSKEIYFSNLAVGMYLINMVYTDGEQKSITIIKK